jgi:hypothetical protein
MKGSNLERNGVPAQGWVHLGGFEVTEASNHLS